MSLGQISRTGDKTPIAGLNGLSGELVPSVSYYQKGTWARSTPTIEPEAMEYNDIVLTTPMPDDDYIVTFNSYGGNGDEFINIKIGNKTATGFRIYASNVSDSAHELQTVTWQAFKLMTDESRALDEQAIADNTAAIATLNTVTDGTLTETSAVNTLYYKSAKKIGRIATITFDAAITGGQSTVLFTSSIKPATVTYFALNSFTAGGTALRASIQTDGRVMLSSEAGVSQISYGGSVTFITAS